MVEIEAGNLVLVDTSVWIDYFRKKEKAYSLVSILMEEERICVVKLIAAELLQGSKSKYETKIFLNLLNVFSVLEEKKDTWINAGILSSRLRSKGRNIKLADCYLAQTAMENEVEIFSYDKHFKEMKKTSLPELKKLKIILTT